MEQYTHISYPDPNYPGTFLKQAPSTKSFSHYLFVENKIYSLLMIFLMICEFIVFKLFYPYPDFFSDSYSYIYAASAHLDVNIWPIGYSKFLYTFHNITHSATALTFFQYLFLELAALYFYHTIIYFYSTGKNTRTFLCLFLFFNPLFLYLSNYVSSDAIFVGLSLIWLTQLLRIVNRPNWYQIVIQALVFFIAFTFRYNAMYYPIIAALAFGLSRQPLWSKAIGILSGPILILPFIILASNSVKDMTGTAQFPPILGGWQWANNALYMREYLNLDTSKMPTSETAELDRLATRFIESVPAQNRDLSQYVANYFIRESNAPLKAYMNSHYKITDGLSEIISWGKAAPIFDQYGKYLIKHHPLEFARYFLLLNTKNYFFPPLEKLEKYNLGEATFYPLAQFWFHLRPEATIHLPVNFQGTLLSLYPTFFMIINLFFLWYLGKYVSHHFHKGRFSIERKDVIMILIFYILNFCFSIFANIIVIRYQIFPMIILFVYSLVLYDYTESHDFKRTSLARSNSHSFPIIK